MALSLEAEMVARFREDLRQLGIDDAAIQDVHILCLPERVGGGTPAEELREAQDSLSFAKYAKAQGARCKTGYDLGLRTPIRERRGDEVWLGTVALFVGQIGLSVLLNILASYLYDRFKGRTPTPGSTPIVHVTLLVVRGESSSQIEYVGDVDLFQRVLRGVGDGEADGATNTVGDNLSK